MDDIQRTLVRAGRKDLAQKYYEKISKKKMAQEKIDLDEVVDAATKIVEKVFKKVDKDKVLGMAERAVEIAKKTNSQATTQDAIGIIQKFLMEG